MIALKIVILTQLVMASLVYSSQWLSLALTGSNPNRFLSKKNCDEIGQLSNHRQVQVCKRNIQVMDSVKDGASVALFECQHQFRYRPWNCTTVQFSRSPVFGNSINGGTREAAFVHAISSAGVAYAVTQACSSGRLGQKCGCDRKTRGQADGFNWGGCSDDIDFGMTFATRFVDARERGSGIGSPARVLMNLHNNRGGRLAVRKFMDLQCKCHGVSGSCNIKTCWRALPNFRIVGDYIKEKFDGATEVEYKLIGGKHVLVPKNRKYKPHTQMDLVYLVQSPDFCEPNPKTGSLGTQGRICNRTSQAIDGCDLMCCGRGYVSRTEVRQEQCACKFFWCCHVRCQTCMRRVEVSYCK
uniref:Protein Wnt n=1 Tax=Nematostella vectensis TaxID=45351 RepID=Q5IRC3_NEMVE|nr:secreted Wnt4 [Nematostella vectensis]